MTKGSTGSQSSSDNGFLPCGQTTQQESLHTPSPCFQQPAVPPTPYVNQTAAELHAKTQSPPVPPRSTATVSAPHQKSPASDTQEPLFIFTTLPQTPPQAQEQLSQCPTSPHSKRTKSKNGHGVKQAKNGKATANYGAPVCWRCGKQGHLKRDCPRPPFCGKCKKEGHVPALCLLRRSQGSVQLSPQQQQDNRFSNPTNRCIHCGGEHKPASCPAKYQYKPTPSTSSYVSPQQGTRGSQSTTGSTTPMLLVNNNATTQGQVRGNHTQQVTLQVSPNVQQNLFTPNVIPHVQQSNQFPPPPYFPILFSLPPVPSSNVSVAPSAPPSDLSAAITLMTNAVKQGNTNTTTITDALHRMTTQFADALQQTIQMGVDAQAEENKNARLDKQFDKIKIFDGSNPADCHTWLEEVHALCTQTGRPFKEMLLLCARQAVCNFIIDMAPDATDEQIKNDLITGYSDLQGLGCKQAAYDNIAQIPEEPVHSYIVRYSRLFKLLNGTAPNDVKMCTTSMHFVNSLRSYLSSKVENRLLGIDERNYSLRDTFKVALQCELKAIASERQHNKRSTIITNNIDVKEPRIITSWRTFMKYMLGTPTIKVRIMILTINLGKQKPTSSSNNLQWPAKTGTRLPTPSLRPAATLTTWPAHRT